MIEQQAKVWVDSYHEASVNQIELFKLYQHFTTIRAHILLDNRHDALLLAEQVLNFSRHFKLPTDEVEVLVLLTIIYWRLRKQK